MFTKIFVNLPVKDLDRTMKFFAGLGFEFDRQFTDENATCMIVDENINVMLLDENFFKTFTDKDVCDTIKYTEMMVALSVDSKKAVDEMVDKAKLTGGSESGKAQDQGPMYGRSFEDIDGHIWEIIYMDTGGVQKISPEKAGRRLKTAVT